MKSILAIGMFCSLSGLSVWAAPLITKPPLSSPMYRFFSRSVT
jgi:hypothetical protein